MAQSNITMKSIFLIEDDIDVTEVIKCLAEKLDFELFWYSDPSKAMADIFDKKPDIVVMDIMMPGCLNGFEVARILKAHTDTKKIPILAISGYDSSQTRLKIFSAGADDYLAKPFDIAELEEKIKNLLAII